MTSEISAADKAQLLKAAIAGRFPDERGRFGPFGGRYVPETLIPAMERLEKGVREHLHSPDFQSALGRELTTWIGRPTALTHATTLSARWGAEVWLEARGPGPHRRAQDQQCDWSGAAGEAYRGPASRGRNRCRTAWRGVGAACARVGLPCVVYMGEVDMERQAPNVGRMRLLGATVTPGDQRRPHFACGHR